MLPFQSIQNPLLALLALLPHILAYEPGTGSSVAGNLSASAPYGISPSKFQSATNNPDDSAAFNITGYNITSSAPSPQSASGWKLVARVKNDVSLSDAANPSDQVFEATTLYLEAPSGMSMDSSWRICGVVYPGVAKNISTGTTVDGGCSTALSSGCLQALNVAGTSGSSGMDDSGACTSFVLPDRCSGDFPTGTGNVSAVGAFSLISSHWTPSPTRSKHCLSPSPSSHLRYHEAPWSRWWWWWWWCCCCCCCTCTN